MPRPVQGRGHEAEALQTTLDGSGHSHKSIGVHISGKRWAREMRMDQGLSVCRNASIEGVKTRDIMRGEIGLEVVVD